MTSLSFGALYKLDPSHVAAHIERVASETATANATLIRLRRSMMEDIVDAYAHVFGQSSRRPGR